MYHQVKRLTAILFLLIYATTAFGITIDFHYCQGKMVKSSLLNISEKPGCCCKDEGSRSMPEDCCNDDVKVCKTDNHKTAQSFVSLDLIEHTIVTHFLDYLLPLNSLNQQISQANLAKPERNPEPVYLLCRVFRI